MRSAEWKEGQVRRVIVVIVRDEDDSQALNPGIAIKMKLTGKTTSLLHSLERMTGKRLTTVINHQDNPAYVNVLVLHQVEAPSEIFILWCRYLEEWDLIIW